MTPNLSTASKTSTNGANPYLLPFILITSLFFMWGFARSILDVLNKHFQESMEISVAQSTMVQASTYVAYALMALPAGIFITKYGYRRGVVFGLLLFGLGALAFIPGDMIGAFGFFLAPLFIIGCGLAVLETAANPYAAELGDPAKAASRLNLSQSFNGLGCILGPVLVGGFLFSGDGESSVALPYAIMGCIVLLVAFLFTRVKLPEIKNESDAPGANEKRTLGGNIKWLWSSNRFKCGVLALFCYEIAEIAINSLFINYVTEDGWMDKITATWALSFGALGLFLLARVAGSAIMNYIKAEKVLAFCAVMTVIGAALVTLDLGLLSRIGLFMCYAFEAIMFPTIFAITISGCASATKIASSFLMMTPLGGAVGTFLMGWVAGMTNMSTSFIVPTLAYCAVLFYAIPAMRGKFKN
ncbi:MAG: MFS transporter [Muribaculaceae bacterium]|nr:MFS transporter [Muribaculaceae bacterium]